MKLYSKKQVSILILVSVAVTFLLTASLILYWIPRNKTKATEISDTDASVREEDTQPSYQPVSYTGNTSTTINRSSYTSDELENIDIYEMLNEGVVNITTITIGYNWFLEPVPQEGGTGSGSIIDQLGHVLTNYHVVKDADKVNITLADGSDYSGIIVGVDQENDLAIVKFDPGDKKLTTVPISQDDTIRVGQKVLAIGNPFGLERTLTTGVVSAQRPIKTESGLIMQGAIQTDASINPGNSGGPLINSRGQMIGINTMIYSPSGGSVGIGFAVPVITARRVIPDLINYGKVNRGWIDITPVQLFSTLVRYAKLPVASGILVSEVGPGGNAEKAGIKGGSMRNAVRYGRSLIYLGGDIIVEIDGIKTDTYSDLYNALEDNKPGETVEVKVLRDKKIKNFTVVLSERPQNFQW